MVRRFDGIDWAVLFNSDEAPNGEPLSAEMDSLMHEAADAVTVWPDIDLFPQFLNRSGG
jgi:N-acyl-D-amino-acid deacylase